MFLERLGYMKIVISLSIALLLLCITALPASACTVFNISNTNQVLVGNNEDYTRTDTKVWFVPSENGKYGKMCFGFDLKYPQGGMNDQGLFFDWFAIGALKPCPVQPGQMLPGDIKLDSTPSLLELLAFYSTNENANNLLLENCKTVDEALSFYKKYYEPSFGYAQLMVVDQNGSSAVITWDWDKNELKIDKKNGDYQIIGSGTQVVEPKLIEGDYEFSADYIQTFLEDASNDATRYSNIYDLKSGTVKVFNMRDYKKSVTINLSDELKKGKADYPLESYIAENQTHSQWYLFVGIAVVSIAIILVLRYLINKRKKLT